MNQFEMYALIAVVAVAVLAVAAVALSVLGIVRRIKGTAKASRRAILLEVGKGVVAIVCVVAIFVANWAVTTYESSINAVFTVAASDSTSTASDDATDDSSETTTEEDWYELAYTIGEEGMVLLENVDDVLPLSEGTKVNLIGYYSYNPYYSGSGSGEVSASDSISILQSLEDAGFEVNPALEDFYPEVATDDSSVGFNSGELSIDEVDVSEYTGDASFEAMAEYSDIAIVTIGRTGGEGYDLTDYVDENGDAADYLELNETEQELLATVCEYFDTVIVLLNTANALNMDILSTYDIDALIWVGVPGPYGFEALGEILNGSVNPSGHLTDTWVYDNDSAPANENFGTQEASNAEGRYYVDYVEGIYVGYKWYETAYAEGAVITTTSTGETFDYTDYESVVAYPFGYGLSYTSFSMEITGGLEDGSSVEATDTFTIEVTVTNTGSVAGKQVVQLYVTVPYTDYDVENGVEKSAATLVAYAKTSELEPGESETVVLEVSMEDVASYDSSYANADGTYGCYMLDEGDYVFSVRTDSHTVVEEVTATLDAQYFFTGDNQRSSDESEVSNQFEDAERGIYLSRNNAFENYAEAMASVVDTIEDTTYATTDEYYDETLDDVVADGTYVEGLDYDADGDLTLADMEGLDYDDELWDELISQLSLEELEELVVDTLYQDPRIKSIDMDSTTHSDGPLGISSMFSSDIVGVSYPCIPLLASTFNVDLAYEMGSQVADQAIELGVTAWYAPAMDTHRSAYSGRNFEYYSEDSYLAGTMAAAEVSGARDKGLIVYIKHFALNDQESERDSIHTYASEQAIREIYLKPFEMAVKDGGATGVMTSMNYIGDTYAGAHYGLITNVLRGEWGFDGTVLTDMDQAGEIRSVMACLRAGTDRWLGISLSTSLFDSYDLTDADIYYLQRAAHNALYTLANATRVATETINWQGYVYVLYAELAVIALAAAASLVVQLVKGGSGTVAKKKDPAA